MLQTEINFISLSQSDSALPDDKGWTGGEGIFRFPPQLWRQFLDDLRRGPGYVASAAARLQLYCHLLTTRLKQSKISMFHPGPDLIESRVTFCNIFSFLYLLDLCELQISCTVLSCRVLCSTYMVLWKIMIFSILF